MNKTRFQKVEEKHLISFNNNQKALAVGLHIIHEITSAQAFSALEKMNLPVKNPQNTFAVIDHVVHTGGSVPNDVMDELLIKTLERNCKKHKITLYGQKEKKQGICHVVAPEVGLTRPNTTIFCGDSHTSTHGAFGAIAAGIGTSNVRDILATGCLLNYTSPKQFKIEVTGKLPSYLSAKDIILYLFSKLGNQWASGGAVFFTGDAIKNLNMEGRMTICNMTIEMGGRFGYCDVDEKTINWFKKDRDFFKASNLNDSLTEEWLFYNTDKEAVFDKTVTFDASKIKQMLSYGLTLNEVIDVEGKTTKINHVLESRKQYEVEENTKATEITIEHAFIGSCTNGRVKDFQDAAKVLKLHGGSVKVKSALAVPGSMFVKKECEQLGIDQIFINAGYEWREAGCSSCLAMNPDKFIGRVASSTNRNFPGRQGPQSRTFLMSPESVALASLEGKFSDLKAFYKKNQTI